MDLIAADVLGHILAFVPANDLACEKKLGTQLCSFELVSKRWKDVLRSTVGGSAWKLACEQDFPGSSAQSREEYIFCLQSAAQSAARVIQRALSKHSFVCVFRRGFRRDLRRDLMKTCCICGVRCSLIGCEIKRCPFIPISDRIIALHHDMRRSKFFACGHCGDRHPDRAMSKVTIYFETYTACFHCAKCKVYSGNPSRCLEWENDYSCDYS